MVTCRSFSIHFFLLAYRSHSAVKFTLAFAGNVCQHRHFFNTKLLTMNTAVVLLLLFYARPFCALFSCRVLSLDLAMQDPFFIILVLSTTSARQPCVIVFLTMPPLVQVLCCFSLPVFFHHRAVAFLTFIFNVVHNNCIVIFLVLVIAIKLLICEYGGFDFGQLLLFFHWSSNLSLHRQFLKFTFTITVVYCCHIGVVKIGALDYCLQCHAVDFGS